VHGGRAAWPCEELSSLPLLWTGPCERGRGTKAVYTRLQRPMGGMCKIFPQHRADDGTIRSTLHRRTA
jgi:hypothetical protein